MKKLFLLSTLFCLHLANAQTYRDSLITDIHRNYAKEDSAYQKLKADIKALEKLEEKPNPEILHAVLTHSYKLKDVDYFKEVLTLLTRKYGFNLSYASGYEDYYNAIIKGDLAIWFKEMYIKNHSEWLSENLDKQIDIYRLNNLREKDQLVHRTVISIQEIKGLADEQKIELNRIDDANFNRNLDTLLEISNKIDNLPTGNSFALIQKHYGIVETHAMQRPNTFEKAWQGLLPFYKKAYLNKNISSLYFKNIDAHMYEYNGKQIFNFLNIRNGSNGERNNISEKEIPLVNPEQTKKLRQELGWN